VRSDYNGKGRKRFTRLRLSLLYVAKHTNRYG